MMRPLYLRASLLLTALVFTAVLSAAAFSVPLAAQTVSLEIPLQTDTAAEEAYILRAVDGEICIYQGDELIRRTGYSVSMLPKEDRTLLDAGIAASSQQALTSLLEDLCS